MKTFQVNILLLRWMQKQPSFFSLHPVFEMLTFCNYYVAFCGTFELLLFKCFDFLKTFTGGCLNSLVLNPRVYIYRYYNICYNSTVTVERISIYKLLNNFFFNTHLGYSLNFTFVCHCQVMGACLTYRNGIYS